MIGFTVQTVNPLCSHKQLDISAQWVRTLFVWWWFMLHGKLIPKSRSFCPIRNEKFKANKNITKVARCGDRSAIVAMWHAFITLIWLVAARNIEKHSAFYVCFMALIYASHFYCLISLGWVFVIVSSFNATVSICSTMQLPSPSFKSRNFVSRVWKKNKCHSENKIENRHISHFNWISTNSRYFSTWILVHAILWSKLPIYSVFSMRLLDWLFNTWNLVQYKNAKIYARKSTFWTRNVINIQTIILLWCMLYLWYILPWVQIGSQINIQSEFALTVRLYEAYAQLSCNPFPARYVKWSVGLLFI